MATGSCLLLALPTELRDHIYILASERPTGSRLILKQWFEKVDVSIDRLPPRTSTTTSNPPLANDDVDADEEEDSATSGDEEDANDAGESENDSEEEHIDEDDAMTDAESQEVPVAAGDTQSVDAEVTMIDEGSENDITEANAGSPDDHNEQVEDDLDSEHDENAGSDNESDVDDGEDGEEVEEEENGEAKDAEEDESDESDEESDGVAAPSASAPPSYGRNTKYRHMRMSQARSLELALTTTSTTPRIEPPTSSDRAPPALQASGERSYQPLPQHLRPHHQCQPWMAALQFLQRDNEHAYHRAVLST